MHATTSELIACRDGEPLDAAVREHIRHCAECAAAMDQLESLRRKVRELPLEEPPAGSWAKIQAARELERPATGRRWTQGLPLALAASLLAAVFSVLVATRIEPPLPVVTNGGGEMAGNIPTAAGAAEPTLAALHERSSYLEQMLNVVQDGSGSVTNLQTAESVSQLQDSIALIDFRLSNSDRYPLTADQRRELWERRVELLESLVTVRYAEARANSI